MDEVKIIQILFRKYIDNTINHEELEQLRVILGQQEGEDDLDKLLQDYFQDDIKAAAESELKGQIIESRAWNQIEKNITPQERPHSYLNFFIKVAAAVLIFAISISIYFTSWKTSTATDKAVSIHDIQPGTSRATLTVANGTKYELKGAKHEIVAGRKNIHYTDGEVVTDAQPGQNTTLTLTTPRGGQFQATLSDGTKVWLNAASSLSYPENFTGAERMVTLEGEAYFEVAHDTRHPFIVSTNGQQIKVLGTSFNVNAYKNERKTVTSLLTGHVQLSNPATTATAELHPGEQSLFNHDHSGFKVVAVDADLYSAWKDGEFRFKATPLNEALRQIERWYDLDIDYTGIPEDILIHASISRNKKLSGVLHALEKITDLKFDVNGRKVKVIK
ncbi:FecR family protein [Mucilaginibacter oryzae]|uniref:FecR family protein n=1 Tax=Mucilaginibacter oryzae TaxID=468058 RepID=A0A316HNM0_9SPHI|nr:FecR family protein [Mucilaginibacter oryzae]PWK79815.1 FecR family protein [Mucilaginibacter oryzae]